MGDGTQSGCRCTGAEAMDCTEYCPFAGGLDDDEYEDDSE